MTFERSTALATELRKASMNASAYSKAPAGKDAFILGNPNADGIKVWVPENSRIKTKVDRKFNQAVLNLHEDERVLTNNQSAQAMKRIKGSKANLEKHLDDAKLRKMAESVSLRAIEEYSGTLRSPFVVTGAVKTTKTIAWTKTSLDTAVRAMRQAINMQLRRIELGNVAHPPRDVALIFSAPIKWEVKMPAQDMTFLVGMDETSHFIAQLPKEVDTVREAHDILKPAGWKDNWLRQGEWFFAPVPKNTAGTLDKKDKVEPKSTSRARFGANNRDFVVSNYDYRTGKQKILGARMEASSSHYIDGDMVKVAGKTYVKGTVKDSRKSHHSDLVLDTWHEVHRNKEVVVAEAPTAKINSAPQRRYWD